MRPAAFTMAVLCLGLAEPVPVAAQSLVSTPGGSVLHAPVKSYYALRFDNVVRQAFDLSCGAAALATLMKYHYGIDTNEKKIIESILEDVPAEDHEKIGRSGFSLLELKREGERAGFTAGGFRIPDVEKLAELRVPAITLIRVRGYSHFVVIKGVQNGIVHVADPAFGNRAKTLEQFAEEWNQIILVFVDPRRDTADSAFSLESAKVIKTRELVSLSDRFLRAITRGAGEF